MDKIKNYYAAITSIIVFLIYFSTMAPSVLQIDTGELAAAQALPGIAHPTGYPLFTMLGWLFSLLPLPVSTIYQLNLFATLTTTVGIYFFIKSLDYLLNNFALFEKITKSGKSKKAKSGKNKEINVDERSFPDLLIPVLSIIGGLTLAFGKTVWFQSTSVEVYSLHLALISAAFYTLLRAFGGKVMRSQSHEVQTAELTNNKQSQKSQVFDWLVFAAVLALAFSNHMTTLLIIPATAYLFFVKFKFEKTGFITLAKMLALFFPLLILIYAYLPIRAGMNPEIIWGNPIDLEKILRHVSGKQYQVWLFSSSAAAAKNFARFFSGLPTEFYLSLVPMLLGVFYLIQRSTKLLVTSLLLIFGTVLYAINYDIVDLESYFLLAYIGMSLLAVFGLLFVYEKVNNLKTTAVVGAVLVLTQAGFTYGGVNQSGNLIFEQYTKAILQTTPKNAVIFSYQWDYFLSASYYFQFVENERRDIAIIDKELLRRSWYYQQLDNCYPWLTGSYGKEADVFKREVVPFEKDLPYAAQVIEGAYKNVMLAILMKNYKGRPVFIAPEVVDKELANKEIELPANIRLVPDLFFYRLTDNDEYIPAADPSYVFESGGIKNIYIEQINALSGAMLLRRAQYELSYNKKQRAKIYIDKVLKDFPDTTVPPELLEAIK